MQGETDGAKIGPNVTSVFIDGILRSTGGAKGALYQGIIQTLRRCNPLDTPPDMDEDFFQNALLKLIQFDELRGILSEGKIPTLDQVIWRINRSMYNDIRGLGVDPGSRARYGARTVRERGHGDPGLVPDAGVDIRRIPDGRPESTRLEFEMLWKWIEDTVRNNRPKTYKADTHLRIYRQRLMGYTISEIAKKEHRTDVNVSQSIAKTQKRLGLHRAFISKSRKDIMMSTPDQDTPLVSPAQTDEAARDKEALASEPVRPKYLPDKEALAANLSPDGEYGVNALADLFEIDPSSIYAAARKTGKTYMAENPERGTRRLAIKGADISPWIVDMMRRRLNKEPLTPPAPSEDKAEGQPFVLRRLNDQEKDEKRRLIGQLKGDEIRSLSEITDDVGMEYKSLKIRAEKAGLVVLIKMKTSDKTILGVRVSDAVPLLHEIINTMWKRVPTTAVPQGESKFDEDSFAAIVADVEPQEMPESPAPPAFAESVGTDPETPRSDKHGRLVPAYGPLSAGEIRARAAALVPERVYGLIEISEHVGWEPWFVQGPARMTPGVVVPHPTRTFRDIPVQGIRGSDAAALINNRLAQPKQAVRRDFPLKPPAARASDPVSVPSSDGKGFAYEMVIEAYSRVMKLLSMYPPDVQKAIVKVLAKDYKISDLEAALARVFCRGRSPDGGPGSPAAG